MKKNSIFRKFLTVALCLVVAGTSSGYSVETKTETEEVCEDESDEALSTAYEENTEDSVSFDLIDAK